MFGRQFKNCYASISKHSVKLLTVALAMPALVSTPLVFYSEDAESVEVYWECTQEAPLVMGGTTGYQRSIGSDTFSRGRSIGTLIVRCVKTDDEVTYENFRASGTLQDTSLHNRGQDNFPTSDDGGSPAIDSDGAITYFLRGSGTDAERVRWAVKRETSSGNPPTQYLIKACENEGNSGMCYVPADDDDGLADLTAAQLNSREIYWQLMNLSEETDGDRKSTIADAGTATRTEYLVAGNEDNFIRGMYETDSGTTTAVDSVMLNPNGLTKFEMVIDGLGGINQVRPAGGDATEQENIVHIKPGGPFQSIKLHVRGGSVVTAGQEGVDNDNTASAKGSYGILVSDPEAASEADGVRDWTGPVTVQVSDTSRVETWASKVAGRHASAIHIDMGSKNNNVARVILDASTLQNPDQPRGNRNYYGGLIVRSNTDHHAAYNGAGSNPVTDEIDGRGRWETLGNDSSVVEVRYPGGDGDVTVNLKNLIKTTGQSSSGIVVQLAEDTTDPAPAARATSSGAYVKTSSPGKKAGIVYDVDQLAKIQTAGDNAVGIIAEADYSGSGGDAEDFHAFIRIGDAIDGVDSDDDKTVTKIVVDNPITILDAGRAVTPSVAQGKSHGVLVIATSSMSSDPGVSSTLHPLNGRDWTVPENTKRNVEIDVNNWIDMYRNGYAVALLGDAGTKNTVRVSLTGYLKSGGATLRGTSTPAARNAALFWKGDDTLSLAGLVNGGSIDFGAGKDTMIIDGGVVGIFSNSAWARFGSASGGEVTPGATIDFGDGVDKLELRHGTVRSPVTNLEELVKSGERNAEIGDVTFTAANGAGNTMMISGGKLLVYGHVNVGATGTVTVASAADLIIVATGAGAATLGDPNPNLGRITAGSIDFLGKDGDDELVTILATASGSQAADVTRAKLLDGNGWLGTGTQVKVSGEDHTLVDGNYADTLTEFTLKRYLTIDAGASAPREIVFGRGEHVLAVSGSARGAIDFGYGKDELHLTGGILFEAVDMGADEDTVTLHSGYVDGAITNVETMVKATAGDATVGAVTFTGSTLTINAGRLFISGHVDLGTDADDVVTIKSSGGIVIVATGASGGQTHGQITASRVKFEGTPRVHILATRATTRTADVQLAQRQWLGNSATRVVGADNALVDTSAPEFFRTMEADDRTPRSGSGGGGTASDSDSNSYYAIGALAVLWLILRDDDDSAALVDYESDGATATFAGVKGAEQFRSGGTRMWAKLYSDSSVSAQQGLAVGMDSRIGENGYFGVSAMPNISGAANTVDLSLNRRTSFEGGRYEAKGGWQKDSMFASVRLSHGEFRGSTSFRNLFEAGGQLGGSFDMSHSHLEVGAGVQLSAGEQMTLVPSLGVYGGSMKQGGHAASNAVLVADVPGYSQSYQGWRAGVQLKSSDWLSISDSTKIRPQLGFNVYRTHTSGPGSLNMNQRDQLGILNFTNKLRVRGLPSTVNAFKAGLSMKNSSGASVKLNYVGYEADGKIQHGAMARMQVRF